MQQSGANDELTDSRRQPENASRNFGVQWPEHVRKRPGGKYQASYIGPDLVRHCAPKTFTAKMDAEHWLSDERRMIERGDWTSPRKRVENVVAQHITLAEYGQTWINQRNVKPRTRACLVCIRRQW